MCQVGGVANLHVATELGPEALTRLLPAKLDAVQSLPASVRKVLDAESEEPAVLAALTEAGRPGHDGGEPSWGVLAHLVRETRFVQVFRRLDFLRNRLAVPVGDYWNEARTLIAGHRYYRYLESFSLPPQEAIRFLTEAAGQIDTANFENTGFHIASNDRSRTTGWTMRGSRCKSPTTSWSTVKSGPRRGHTPRRPRKLGSMGDALRRAVLRGAEGRGQADVDPEECNEQLPRTRGPDRLVPLLQAARVTATAGGPPWTEQYLRTAEGRPDLAHPHVAPTSTGRYTISRRPGRR